MSSGRTLVGDLVKLIDETDTVRIGPGTPSFSPPPKLEVVGNGLLTLQDKGGNVFDVKAYGAKGDAVSDDVSKINDALTALTAAGGGTLYFPPGKYLVTSEVLVNGNVPVLVCGAGPEASAIWIRNPNASLPSTHNAFRFLWTGASSTDRELYMEVRDLRFEPPSVNPPPDPTAGAAIRQECNPLFQNTFVVRNCWFRNVFNGVNITQTGSSAVGGCQFLNPKNAAILLEQKTLSSDGVPADVGIYFISECYFFERPGSVAPYGVLATSGASGLRLHHNYFLGFTNPILLDLVDGAMHTALAIDDNALDGASAGEKILIRGKAEVRSFHICNNQINAGTHGLRVELQPSSVPGHVGRLSQGVIAGNVFNGAGGKGIFFNPAPNPLPGAEVSNVLISGNHFNNLATGIELATAGCELISILANSFDTNVTTPLSNLGTQNLGAFFPDRLGVGRANNLASLKEIFAYSAQALGPRVYLRGESSSTPGVELAFDDAGTRRVGIVGRAVGSNNLGAQMEFYTKPDTGGAITERVFIDPNGHVVPAADNAYNLGQTSTLRWKDVIAVAKHSVLDTSFGSGRTLVPVLEGPEYLLYDSGSLTLGDGGEAWVDLDPRFLEIANTDVPYRVLTSGCRVSEREKGRFRVAGNPGDVVDWMAMAVRAGFENVRFRDAKDAEPVGQADPEHAVARKSPSNNMP